MWSGPGRALQFHVELYDNVARARKWIDQANGRAPVNSVPPLIAQRMRLMSSMGHVGVQLMIDGHTISTQRDDESVLTSTANMYRSIGLVEAEYETLNKGQTHYVSHHVASAVEAAAKLAADEPLFPTDLPCPEGLIVFEYPILTPDLDPKTGAIVPELTMPLRAIGWSTQKVHARRKDYSDEDAANGVSEMEQLDGIFYVLYTDRDAYMDLFVPGASKLFPDYYGEGFMPEIGEFQSTWCIDTSGWAFGKPWARSAVDDETFRDEMGQGKIHNTVAYIRRFMLSYFRWTWQRLLVAQTYHPSRPESKRALRAGKPLEDGYVKVLRLRREVEAEQSGRPETDGFYFDHQWIVRGHWRRQWYKSLGPARLEDGSFNADSHRMVWIEPHTSGNPYGPLVVGHEVVAAVR